MSEKTKKTERDEIKAILDELGVKYAKNAPTKKLIELRDARAHVVTEEDVEMNEAADLKVGETVYLPIEGDASFVDEAPEGAEIDEKVEDEPEVEEGDEPAEDEAGEPDEDTEEVDEPETEEDDDMPTETEDYIVVTPVKYMGTIYPAGEKLRLNPEDACRLLKNGAISRA